MIDIKATTIPDAWFQALYEIAQQGRRYEIQHGSMVDESRLELDFVVVRIQEPYQEPWEQMLPEIPAHMGMPDPVEPGYLYDYIPYLMAPDRADDEEYTYGERIYEQVQYWTRKLSRFPETNQAILQVGRPEDYLLSDPPCLRHIDMRIRDGRLIFYPYFRSWDLWAGLPANLAGIAVLQKYMATNIGVQPGAIVASSKGLHVYGYAEDLVKRRIHAN